MSSDANDAVIELRHISKSFGQVTVLKDINLRFPAGKIVGLLGVNGAGKSTLIKIICGVYTADSGEIIFENSPVTNYNASTARRMGIQTVHQELSLIPSLSVYENVYLNDEITIGKKTPISPLRKTEMRLGAYGILKTRLGVDLDVDTLVENLPISTQQLVEIARAVKQSAKVLILDEPTTSLESKEKDRLFKAIRELRNNGSVIIYISHHLDEILELCDRTLVLRDGELVLDDITTNTSARELVTAMTGKQSSAILHRTSKQNKTEILSVSDLTLEPYFQHVTFSLHQGEVIGLAGLNGSGKNQVIRTLCGALSAKKGKISIKNKDVGVNSIRQSRRLGFSYLTSDRKTEGIFPEHSLSWNGTISDLKKIRGRFGLSRHKEFTLSEKMISDYKIKADSQFQKIYDLSGGNQQKVLLARCAMCDPDILLLDDPTRGIDVAAKNDIYTLINKFLTVGKSIILISSEENELITLCDRILVFRDGEIKASLDASEVSIEKIRFIAMSNEKDHDDSH